MDYSDKVKQLNPSNDPIVETDYYNNMSDGGYNDNRMDCKISYLKTLGFVVGDDKVDEAIINTLDMIHAHYFNQNNNLQLLKEAHARFKDYEMDVDDYPSLGHRDFMKRLSRVIWGE